MVGDILSDMPQAETFLTSFLTLRLYNSGIYSNRWPREMTCYLDQNSALSGVNVVRKKIKIMYTSQENI